MIRRSFLPILLITVLALTLRMTFLDLRPLHTDEAVHAIKFGKLLEDGYYRYNPVEYHGPTLNYLTLIPARLLSQKKITSVTEFTLRSVPAFLGTCLILLLLLVKRHLQRSSWILSALFLALSPVMVFYSRYYIQEMLLVFFLYGFIFCFYRWMDSPGWKWALVTGLFGGMMIATKETWILSLIALILSVVLLRLTTRHFRIRNLTSKISLSGNLLLMGLSAILVAGLFYSSFFSNFPGIADAFNTYTGYLEKAGNLGQHLHRWDYYLQLLIYHRSDGMIWTEVFLVLGGGAGFIFALKKVPDTESRFFLYIAMFSAIAGIIYSAMPYKTPWNLLPFYSGWILLAGYGFSNILSMARSRMAKRLSFLVLVLVLIQLGFQTYALNFVHETDPSNPWVYGHTGRDIYRLVEKINEVARAQPEPEKLRIDMIVAHHDYWPLPWYLRDYPNTGWWDHVEKGHQAAPLIIASPAFRTDIMTMIYETPPPGQRYLYLPLLNTLVELRPGIFLEGYIRKDLWDRWEQKKRAR